MSKKKKKKIAQMLAEEIEEAPRSRRRFWIGAGIGSLVLAAILGIAGSCYYGKTEEKPAEKTQTACQQSLPEKWTQCYNEEGVLLSEEYLASKYEIFKRHKQALNSPPELKKTLEDKLQAEVDAKVAEFEKNIAPEKYTPIVFYGMYAGTHCLQKLITDGDVMQKIMEIFNFTSKTPLFKELRQIAPSNDHKLVEQMLNCAVLMTHKRLTKDEKEIGDSKEEFLDHLRKKVGDCSDYSYAAANLYVLICHNLDRPDLTSKIRLVMGATVRPDGKFKGYHGWMQIYNPDGRWHDLQINEDYIEEDTPISMSTQALYKLIDREGNFYIPFVSTTIVPKKDGGYEIELRSHIPPIENGK